MKRISLYNLGLISALFIAPFTAAAAQTPAPVAALNALTPERIAAGRELLRIIMPPEQREQMFNQMLGGMMNNIMSGQAPMIEKLSKEYPEIKPIYDDYIARIKELTLQRLNAQLPDMFEAMARAYARRFSISEMQEIGIFFGGPTGKIYQQKSMTIMSDPDVGAWQQKMMADTMRDMPAEMAKFRAEIRTVLEKKAKQ